MENGERKVDHYAQEQIAAPFLVGAAPALWRRAFLGFVLRHTYDAANRARMR